MLQRRWRCRDFSCLMIEYWSLLEKADESPLKMLRRIKDELRDYYIAVLKIRNRIQYLSVMITDHRSSF